MYAERGELVNLKPPKEKNLRVVMAFIREI